MLLSASLFSLALYGKEISQEDALSISKNFIAKKFASKTDVKKSKTNKDLTLSYVGKKGTKNCFYVYNMPTGGFVIASADSRTSSPVFGYSNEGEFDYEKLGDNARGWIDSYADMVCALDTLPLNNISLQRRTTGKTVAPLLGETAWGQGYPYNIMCPQIDGQRCVTGCVATAVAQVMYYHKWPEHGNGVVSGYSGYDNSDIDLSESQYRWDLMQPIYDDASTTASKEAVALLMHDVGYAIGSSYSLTATSAMVSYAAIKLFENFDYSASIAHYYRAYYSDDDWDNIIFSELDNMRPCVYAGGIHCFVCDGYDEDGYLHFNFGWSGTGNGYFLSSVAGGFSTGQELITHIMKNNGEDANIFVRTTDDIFWSDNVLRYSNVNISAIGIEKLEDYITGFFLVNKSTGKVTWPSEKDFTGSPLLYKSVTLSGSIFTDFIKVFDGEYDIYFGVGNKISNQWHKALLPNNDAPYISLTVKDEQKFFENHTDTTPGEGRIYKDGIFYKLDQSTHTASVTNKNDTQKFYSGNIIIPNTIEIDGEIYEVTEISEMAFADCCNLESVTIPKNVVTIGNFAFAGSYLNSVKFEAGSKLETIGNYAFFQCDFEVLNLPENLVNIELRAFKSCFYLKNVDIPKSVKKIGYNAFDLKYTLKNISVHWDNPIDTPDAFEWGDNEVTLQVPLGTKDLYKNMDCWSPFNIVEGYWSDKIKIGDLWYSFFEEGNNAKITNGDDEYYSIPELIIPETVEYNGKIYTVEEIDEKAFLESVIDSVYIPKSVIKICCRAFFLSTIEKVIFEENSQLNEIDNEAFLACVHLKEITLPDKLKIIGVRALRETNLLKLEIPVSVEKIGFNAFPTGDLFPFHKGISDIIVKWTEPKDLGTIENEKKDKVTLHVPNGTKHLYEAITTWSQYNIVDNDSDNDENIVTVDGIRYSLNPTLMSASVISAESSENAYEGDIVLKSEIDKDGKKFIVREIEAYAFGGGFSGSVPNDKITSVFIPKTIEKIGTYAFWGSRLDTINVEDGSELKEISSNAFQYNIFLKILPYLGKLEVIGDFCFVSCLSLKEVYLPESLKSIGIHAFTTYGQLEKVHVYWQDPVEFFKDSFEEEGNSEKIKDMVLYVPKGTKEKYSQVSPWRYFGEIIEEEESNSVVDVSANKTFFKCKSGGVEICGEYETLNVFDMQGRLVESANGKTFINLNKGIYIINIDGVKEKVMIH